jgi:hypothetical protein
MSSANRDFLDSFFTCLYPFIYSSCLISLAMLSRGRESGYPCLVPDFRGNSFSFSTLNMMLAIGLSYSLSNVEVHSFYS